MARTKRYEKNLSRVQSMLDGTYGSGKAQVGYTPTEVKREIGDIWTDSDDITWEQKDGFRSQVSKMAHVGVFSKQCKDCDTNCASEKRHFATWKRFDRCFYCQLEFEAKLKSRGKWKEWVMEQETMRWEAVIKEIKEIDKNNKENDPFSKKMANSIANENVDMTIINNKKTTK